MSVQSLQRRPVRHCSKPESPGVPESGEPPEHGNEGSTYQGTRRRPAAEHRVARYQAEDLASRRVLEPETITLARLHGVIQAAIQWGGGHLHEFEVAGVRHGTSDPDYNPPGSVRSERMAVSFWSTLRISSLWLVGVGRLFRWTPVSGRSDDEGFCVTLRLNIGQAERCTSTRCVRRRSARFSGPKAVNPSPVAAKSAAANTIAVNGFPVRSNNQPATGGAAVMTMK